jgi:Spy/CpxP family protein refolding chaperone
MKIAVVNKLCLAAVLALGAMSIALAAPPQSARPMPGPQGDFRQREDFNGQDHRNQMSGEQEQRRAGKLSPDERRELRRQINEVGQDIYRVKR